MRILQITNKDNRLEEFEENLKKIAHVANENHHFGRVMTDGVIINPFIHFQGLPPKLNAFLQILAQKCMMENYQLIHFRFNEDESSWSTKKIEKNEESSN